MLRWRLKANREIEKTPHVMLPKTILLFDGSGDKIGKVARSDDRK
jgi:hypothetical protein